MASYGNKYINCVHLKSRLRTLVCMPIQMDLLKPVSAGNSFSFWEKFGDFEVDFMEMPKMTISYF